MTLAPARAPVPADAPHVHHWRIAPPDGPVSDAFCLTCEATRTFSNDADQHGYTRTCPRCGLVAHASASNFPPERSRRGLGSVCAACRAAERVPEAPSLREVRRLEAWAVEQAATFEEVGA